VKESQEQDRKRTTCECVWLCIARISRFLLLWPWPLPDDLEIRNWPRQFEDVAISYAYRSELSRSRRPSKGIAQTGQTQTDRPTDKTDAIECI